MGSEKIQAIVNKFVAEIMEAAEEAAMESLQERLGEVFSGAVMPLVKRRKSTKGRSILRPCPVKGCKKVAAPRYQMVCKEHSETLSREDIVVARDKADKPGGVWYEMKNGKKSA